MLAGLKPRQDPRLLVGMETADDAGVYQLTDELALIQTLDFFTPIVDDPYRFGQIAAANALSDVYAMGGRPLCVMNIVCFPIDTMDVSVLGDVLRGGQDKIHEAGACLAGGHSISDPELKYGLSVSGIVHPQRIWTNRGAREGDLLVLTKPLGTGIVGTAVKRAKASATAAAAAEDSMALLNADAQRFLEDSGEVHACTDVTGFGLVGHACEMLDDSGLCAEVQAAALPLLPEAQQYAEQGLRPGGLERNRAHRQAVVDAAEIPDALQDLLYDPQTSGGLLAAVAPEQARFIEANQDRAWIIGEVKAAEADWLLRVV